MGNNVQNNYIVLTCTITQHYSPRHTLRAAVVASQQVLQAPRSSESTCNALLGNVHEMSMERRKQHPHDALPSRIDPFLSWDGCARALVVQSHLTRAATPTEGPICAETQDKSAKRRWRRATPGDAWP